MAEPMTRYEYGWWSTAYMLEPVNVPPSLATFHDILDEVTGHETGWPVWLRLSKRPEMRPRIVGDVIECWLDQTGDDAHGDFWRADPHGRMFLLRGYQEDSSDTIPPGKFLDLTLPIWRTGECLLHASRLAARLGADTVDISMRWTGLRGRELAAWATGTRDIMPGRICAEDEVRSSIHVEAATITDSLAENVRQLVAPLYERFDFFEPTSELYIEELARMRRGI